MISDMKDIRREFVAGVIIAALFFGAVLLFSGCPGPRETVELPVLPKWEAPANPALLGPYELVQHVGAVDGQIAIRTDDGAWVTVNYDYARRVVDWYMTKNHVLGRKHVTNSWPCDKYAKDLVLAFAEAAAREGIPAMPLVGLVVVTQEHAWGGIGRGGMHAVVWVGTDRGVYIVEPQTGYMQPVGRYPNPMFEVRIGG